MKNKEKIIIFLFVILSLIILGCTYIIYNFHTKEERKNEEVIDDKPVSIPVEKEEKNEDSLISTKLDEDTQKLVDKIAASTGEKTIINDAWIFNILLEEIARNTEVIGYDGGDLHKISKETFFKKVKFISKNKSVQEIINVQNDHEANYFNYKIKENEDNYIITIPGHENIDNIVELTNKETENNKLILTYKVSCYGGDSSTYFIGETTVTLDYIENQYYLNNTKFRSNGLNVSCH